MEEEFINLFIRKEKRERLLFELKNPKKREYVFWKFSGTDLFIPQCLHEINESFRDIIETYIHKSGKIKSVYYIGESAVGILPLGDAENKVRACERCVIYFGDGLGYYQGEREIGKAGIYLLKSNL